MTLSAALELSLVSLSGGVAHLGVHGFEAPPPVIWLGIAMACLLTLNLFHAAGLYRFRLLASLGAQSSRVVTAWTGAILCILAIGFLTQTLDAYARSFVVLWWGLAGATMLVWRVVLRHAVRRGQTTGWLTRNVVLVGSGEHAARLIRCVHRRDPGVRFIGIFDDRKTRVPGYIAGFPVLGTIDDLLEFARREPIDQVIVALPWNAENRLLDCLRRLRQLPLQISLCPDLIGFHMRHRGLSHLAGIPLLDVFDRPMHGWSGILKSVEDRVLAALVLIAVAPLMLVLALAIKLTSPGPVLFRQARYGFNNEIIHVLKFRTMDVAPDDPAEEPLQAVRHDARVTLVGRFLRRTSLDELPQFLNVLWGDMSIVGPRPHAVMHNLRYAGLIDEYLARHRVKPGITGWAQVNGLRGETDTLEKMQERVRYDLHYIDNWSLGLDLRIILRTLLVGFSHPNAY